jgi:hypothetical protein
MEVSRLNKPVVPRKHVIDEYRHKAQTVTCLCGWHGSTASVLGEPSDWALHVKENRGRTF